MNKPLKIQKIGNSAGVVFPKELLAQLGVEIGSTLSVTPTSRGIELSASDAEFERQMEIAREVMARRRQALRELAK
jgi:putative addiction module antidote